MNRRKPSGHLIFETAVLAVWIVLALLLPGLSLTHVLGPALVWLLVSGVSHALGLGFSGARWALSAAMALVGTLLLVNLSFFNSSHGATPDNPYIVNFDAAKTWLTSHEYAADFSKYPYYQWGAYGMLMSPFVRFGGLCAMLSFSALMTMLSIAFTGRIAASFSSDRAISRSLAVAAMVMLTLVGSYITTGTIIIKDALVCAGFAGVALCTLELRRGPRGAGFAVWLLVLLVLSSIMICARIRAGYLAILMVLFLVPDFRDSRQGIAGWIAALLVCVAVSATAIHYSVDWTDTLEKTMTTYGNQVFASSPRGSVLNSFITDYPSYPLWQRMLLIPFSLGLQLFIPLPWTFMRHIDYGPSLVLAHFNIFLYLEAGLVLYFLFTALRRAPRPLVALTLSGLALYTGVAFLFGGSVSRYTLPFLPLLMPSAAYVAMECRNARMVRWMAVYTAIVLIVLAAGFYLYQLAPAANETSI